MPSRKSIIEKAMEYKTEKFMASKGWCDKFLKRNYKDFTEYKEKYIYQRNN